MKYPKQANEYKVEDLGFGHLGNGVTVWDRSRERNGDYLTVAHISRERKIDWHAKVSPAQKERIEEFARTDNMTRSATQNELVLVPIEG